MDVPTWDPKALAADGLPGAFTGVESSVESSATQAAGMPAPVAQSAPAGESQPTHAQAAPTVGSNLLLPRTLEATVSDILSRAKTGGEAALLAGALAGPEAGAAVGALCVARPDWCSTITTVLAHAIG